MDQSGIGRLLTPLGLSYSEGKSEQTHWLMPLFLCDTEGRDRHTIHVREEGRASDLDSTLSKGVPEWVAKLLRVSEGGMFASAMPCKVVTSRTNRLRIHNLYRANDRNLGGQRSQGCHQKDRGTARRDGCLGDPASAIT